VMVLTWWLVGGLGLPCALPRMMFQAQHRAVVGWYAICVVLGRSVVRSTARLGLGRAGCGGCAQLKLPSGKVVCHSHQLVYEASTWSFLGR
jgi:hypothetical protein